MAGWYDPPVTLDRVRTDRGELVLRKAGDRFEVISNGVFLMDTSDGRSERLLVDAALHRCRAAQPRLLIGGLGVGFSLIQAAASPRWAAIDVSEIEKTIIGWHDTHLRHLTGAAMADPRLRIIEADVLAWLELTGDTYDAICLDTDNGPNWLVFDSNAGVYGPHGLALARRRLRPDGLLAVWSASRDQAYEDRLRESFSDIEVLEVEQARGDADVVYLARHSARQSVGG